MTAMVAVLSSEPRRASSSCPLVPPRHTRAPRGIESEGGKGRPRTTTVPDLCPGDTNEGGLLGRRRARGQPTVGGWTTDARRGRRRLMTRILLVGWEPDAVDFSDPALPPGM